MGRGGRRPPRLGSNFDSRQQKGKRRRRRRHLVLLLRLFLLSPSQLNFVAYCVTQRFIRDSTHTHTRTCRWQTQVDPLQVECSPAQRIPPTGSIHHLKSCRDEFREAESFVYIGLQHNVFMNIFTKIFNVSSL